MFPFHCISCLILLSRINAFPTSTSILSTSTIEPSLLTSPSPSTTSIPILSPSTYPSILSSGSDVPSKAPSPINAFPTSTSIPSTSNSEPTNGLLTSAPPSTTSTLILSPSTDPSSLPSDGNSSDVPSEAPSPIDAFPTSTSIPSTSSKPTNGLLTSASPSATHIPSHSPSTYPSLLPSSSHVPSDAPTASQAPSSEPTKPSPIRWIRRLNGCGTLSDASPRKGNGVVLSHNGKHVWVTDDEGTLHILDADNSTSDHITFKPPVVDDRSIESRSSVELLQNETTVEFAVYAVLDVARDEPTGAMITSRIIAVYGDDDLLGKMKWNASIQGVVTGTPRIGTGGNTTTIYVTHNVNGRGYLSVFSREGNRTAWISGENPFGPVTVLCIDEEDEVYWGESGGEGYSNSGRIYHFAASTGLYSVGNETVSSTVVSPVVWRERKRHRMWLGGRSSTVHGWINGQPLSEAPTWSKQLEKSLRNESFRK